MKKILSLILIVMIGLLLVACGDAPVISDHVKTEESFTNEYNSETPKEELYSNKVYYVGDDIPVGTYVIKCTNTESRLEVLIFSSENEYQNFKNAKKTTIGEYGDAVEAHAWGDFYLNKDEQVYIGLDEGYVVLLDKGKCEFCKYDALENSTLYSGIYVVGEDIEEAKINIKCITKYLRATVFESKDKYLEYHKADRFTIGKESDAITKYSITTDFIYKDDFTYANLKDGMVLMIEDGTGEYFVDEGPIIK